MNYYEYTAETLGRKTHGIVTADDIEGASENIKKRGMSIIEIDEMKDFLGIRRKIYNISNAVGKKTIIEFYTMIIFMLESGMGLHETLTSVRDNSINGKLKNLARVTADEVRKGGTLSSAMNKSGCFTRAEQEQVKAGEESGNMLDTLKRMLEQAQREVEFKGKIKGAMMYPIIICIVMVGVLGVLMTVVVPSLSKTLISLGGELPLITKIVIGISNFFVGAIWYIIIGIICAIISFKILKKNTEFRFKVDSFKLKIPLVGSMIERIELSRFCRNLQAMQASGITLATSLKIVEGSIKNLKISKSIKATRELIEVSGMNLGNALAKSGNFPQLMIQLVEIGISSGQIQDVLARISDRYENEVDDLLKRITSLIEPIMIVFVGILAGTVVISVFVPMMSVTDFI